jgi:hypothetical protein
VHLGAKFLGGIPFPFITIRTNKLEVNDCHRLDGMHGLYRDGMHGLVV